MGNEDSGYGHTELRKRLGYYASNLHPPIGSTPDNFSLTHSTIGAGLGSPVKNRLGTQANRGHNVLIASSILVPRSQHQSAVRQLPRRLTLYSNFPHPPPPGVSIRSTSSAAISNRVFAGSACGFAPLRSNVFRPGFPRFPARQPVSPPHPPVRKNRDLCGRQKPELAHDAIAAAMRAPAARILAHAVALDAHRILVLERLHRSVPAIGHVRMRGAIPVAFRRRAHPARNGFVVCKGCAHQPVPRQSSSYSSCRNSPPECVRVQPSPARPESHP